MSTDTPRTDAGCAPIFFSNGNVTIAADPEISRQLERELNEANKKLEWLRSIAERTYPMWGYNTASWKLQFSRKLDDSVKDTLSKDFFTAIEQCMEDAGDVNVVNPDYVKAPYKAKVGAMWEGQWYTWEETDPTAPLIPPQFRGKQ